MQDDFDPAGVCITAAVGPPWPVRIRLATSAPLASTDRALCAAGRRSEKLKVLLQRLTRHPHPAPWWRPSLLSVAMLVVACSGGGVTRRLPRRRRQPPRRASPSTSRRIRFTRPQRPT